MNGFVLLLFLIGASSQLAAGHQPIYLSPNGTDVPTCGSEADPCQTFAFALSSFSPSLILLLSGRFPLSSTVVLSNKKYNQTELAIQAAAASSAAVECADRSFPAFASTLSGFELSIQGFSIANCAAGVFMVNGASLSAASMQFFNNGGSSKISGAAILSVGVSLLHVSHCDFFQNVVQSDDSARSNKLFLVNDAISFDPTNLTASSAGAISFTGGSAVHLHNSTFSSNSVADLSPSSTRNGGAVAIRFAANVSITDCLFQNNSAGVHGGALYLFNVSSVSVSSTRFLRNLVASEGQQVAGGAMFLQSTASCNLSDSLFFGNSAYGFGFAGAVGVQQGNVVAVSNCSFLDNFAGFSAAAFFFNNTKSSGAVPIISSIFQGNAVVLTVSTYNQLETATNMYGGAIYLSHPLSVLVQDCVFRSNAIVIQQSLQTVIQGALDAAMVNSAQGGAIAIIGVEDLEINDSSFRNNSVQAVGICFAQGGALSIQPHIARQGSTTFMTHSDFSDNDALSPMGGEAGAGYFLSLGEDIYPWLVSIHSCKFTNNTASYPDGKLSGAQDPAFGGALSFQSVPSLEIHDSTFEGNSAAGITSKGDFVSTTYGYGGAIAMYEVLSAVIQDSLFRSNSVIGGTTEGPPPGGEASGGAIYASFSKIDSPGIFILNNTEFINCTAIGGPSSSHGGDALGGAVALYLSNKQCTLDVIDCTFTNNSGQGGQSGVEFNGGAYSNEVADAFGGTFFIQIDQSVSVSASFLRSTFVNNSVLASSQTGAVQGFAAGGAGIFLYSTDAKSRVVNIAVDDCLFSQNSARSPTKNTEADGAALAISMTNLDKPQINISNSFFAGNTVQATIAGGGAILFSGGAKSIAPTRSTFAIFNSTFQRNSASSGIEAGPQPRVCGGAVFLQAVAETDIRNSRFLENSAALDSLRKSASIYNTMGGALYLITCDSLVVTDSRFENNLVSATSHKSKGGAIGIQSARSVLFEGALFIGNVAHSFLSSTAARGGALCIFFFEANTLTIRSSVFEGNRVSQPFSGSDISNNVNAGGAIYFETEAQTNIEISQSSFSNNTANSTFQIGGAYGGAIAVLYSVPLNESLDMLLNEVNFTSNTAVGDQSGSNEGGALYLANEKGSTRLHINASNFDSNSAVSSLMYGQDSFGGAISLRLGSSSSLSFQGSLFRSNYARGGVGGSKGGHAQGGALFLSSPEASDCELSIEATVWSLNAAEGSTSEFFGGSAAGGHFSGSCSLVGLSRSSFECGSALGGSGIISGPATGGAVSLSRVDNFTIDACTFDNNQAVSATNISEGIAAGGALFARSSITQITATNLTGNAAVSSRGTAAGGAFFLSQQGQQCSILSSTLANNQVLGNLAYGGGISIQRDFSSSLLNETNMQLSVTNCTMISQTTTSQLPSAVASPVSFGGAIFFNGTSLSLSAVNFHRCAAQLSNADSISLLSTGKAAGGAVFAGTQWQSLLVAGCNFEENAARIEGRTIKSVKAEDLLAVGGALFIDSSHHTTVSTVQDSAFLSNQVQGCEVASGGSILDLTATGTSYERIVVRNSTALSTSNSNENLAYGGGLSLLSSPSSWDAVEISNCSAQLGGAVSFTYLSRPLPLNGSTFVDNFASWSGGAVWIEAWTNSMMLADFLQDLASVAWGNSAKWGPTAATRPIASESWAIAIESIQSPSNLTLRWWSAQEQDVAIILLDGFGQRTWTPNLWLLLDNLQSSPFFTSSPSSVRAQFSSSPNFSYFVLQGLGFDLEPGIDGQIFWSVSRSSTGSSASLLNSSTLFKINDCPPGYSYSADPPTCNLCPNGQYSFDQSECLHCPRGEESKCMNALSSAAPSNPTPSSVSKLSANQLEVLVPPGYYPNEFESPSALLSCRNEACLNMTCLLSAVFNNSAWSIECETLCEEGYSGRLCSMCTCEANEEQCYFTAEAECLPCPSDGTAIVLFSLFWVGVLLCLLGFALKFKLTSIAIEIVISILGFLLSLTPAWIIGLLILIFCVALANKTAAHGGKGHGHILSHGILKSMVFYLQISNYLTGTNVIRTSISPLKSLKVTSLQCLFPSIFQPFVGRFCLYISYPFLGAAVALIWLVIAYGVWKLRHVRFERCRRKSGAADADAPVPSDEDEQVLESLVLEQYADELQRDAQFPWMKKLGKASNAFWFFIFIIYPDLTEKMFAVLKCDEEGYVEEFPYLRCGKASLHEGHFFPDEFIFVMSIVFIVLFTIGVPFYFFVVMYRNRRAIKSGKGSSVEFLYEAFRPEVYWWGIYGFGRVFVILCITNFVPNTFAVQVLVLFLLSGMFILQNWVKPFRSSLENFVEQCGIFSLIILHTCYQFMIADGTLVSDGFKEFNAPQWFLFSFNLAVVLCFLATLAKPTWQGVLATCGNQKEHAHSRILNASDPEEEE